MTCFFCAVKNRSIKRGEGIKEDSSKQHQECSNKEGYSKQIQVQQFQDSATNKEGFQGGFKVKAHTGQGPEYKAI
jgi:catabolite regulation protein CreA